jgi:hypothetical protein
MTNNARITNLSRGFSLKHKQAERAVENCAAAWVEYGVSIRDLTFAEAVQARNTQASNREPLPVAEIPGIKVTGIDAYTEMRLAWDANIFAAQVV